MDGESLYRQYLSGEKTAFDGIVELYRENLIFFINRYTGDLDAAEDLSQDAFLELLLHPKRYDFRVSLKTYLFTIARNKAFNYLKKQGRIVYSDEETTEKSEAYRSFEQEMLKNEEKRTLHKAIAGLPQDYATVIHLLYFEDMSYSEAGAVMKKIPQANRESDYAGKSGSACHNGKGVVIRMKTPEEYKRTLYEKRDRLVSERKMTRRSMILSFSSAAACLLIVFSVLLSPGVDLFHLKEKDAYAKRIMIEADGKMLRDYEDEKTVLAVDEMLSQMSLTEEMPSVRDEEILYTVTRIDSTGDMTLLYYVEAENKIKPSGIGVSAFSASMSDILEKYP